MSRAHCGVLVLLAASLAFQTVSAPGRNPALNLQWERVRLAKTDIKMDKAGYIISVAPGIE